MCYVLLGFLLWVVVDLGTAGGFRLSYLRAYGPTLLVFYAGYPIVFAWLIFRRGWSGRRLFLATIAAMVLIEAVFTRNPFVISFPLLLIGVPLALCIYSPLTYFPLWIVNREMGRHKGIAVALALITTAVMLLSTLGSGG